MSQIFVFHTSCKYTSVQNIRALNDYQWAAYLGWWYSLVPCLKTIKYTEKWGINDLRPLTSFGKDRRIEAGKRTYSSNPYKEWNF